jgi:hypothetical protein
MAAHPIDLNSFDVTTLHKSLRSPLRSPPRSSLHFPLPKKKCTKDTVFDNIFYVNTCTSVFSCIMVFFLCISGIIIYTDVSKTLVDAQDTLQDLNIILPEIDKTMHMLQHLCNTPDFRPYCGTEQESILF